MTSSKPVETTRSGASKIPAAQAEDNPAHRTRVLVWVASFALAAVALGVLYAVFQHSSSNQTSGAGPKYQVGSPGPGQSAPGFTLASSTGGQVSLTDFRGKTVLLYFQEGLTCQPCWDQIAQLESNSSAMKAAGVDRVVSITTDPADLIAQKTRDMGLSTTVLSDPNLAVSTAYHANAYGMMGSSRDGHTFILVDPNGVISWRADYGGAPDYTMDVPVDQLLSQMRAGTAGQ